jgi:hypothetical protein
MDNVEMKVAGNKLVITIDLTATGALSSTGKTKLIATTHGAVPVGYDKRNGVKVSLNVTVPPNGG